MAERVVGLRNHRRDGMIASYDNDDERIPQKKDVAGEEKTPIRN